VPCKGAADLVDASFHRVSHASRGGSRVAARVGRPSLLAHLVDEVSSSTPTDVVNWRRVLHQLALAIEFLVEAEDGPFFLAVHVTCATATGGEVDIGWGSGELGPRCRSLCVGGSSYVLGIDIGDIAGAAPAGVEDVGCWDGRVWLSDAVVSGHCRCEW